MTQVSKDICFHYQNEQECVYTSGKVTSILFGTLKFYDYAVYLLLLKPKLCKYRKYNINKVLKLIFITSL